MPPAFVPHTNGLLLWTENLLYNLRREVSTKSKYFKILCFLYRKLFLDIVYDLKPSLSLVRLKKVEYIAESEEGKHQSLQPIISFRRYSFLLSVWIICSWDDKKSSARFSCTRSRNQQSASCSSQPWRGRQYYHTSVAPLERRANLMISGGSTL